MKNRKLSLSSLFIVLILISRVSSATDWTDWRTVKYIQVQENSNALYVWVQSGIMAGDCLTGPEGVTTGHVTKKSQNSGYEDIYAAILAAAASGAKIKLGGTCGSPSSYYFDIDYIQVEF